MFPSFINRALICALFFILITHNPLNAACVDATVFEVEKMLQDKGYTLVDVREPYEFNDCRIPGSISIPLANLQKEHVRLDKDAKIIIYCRSGRRSLDACKLLEEIGFKNVVNMVGGIMAWYNTRRPLEGKCEGTPYFAYDRKGKAIRPKVGEPPPEPEIKGCK